jgi:hypothetical protein
MGPTNVEITKIKENKKKSKSIFVPIMCNILVIFPHGDEMRRVERK